MAKMTVQVSVGDYAKWRAVFDKYEGLRSSVGVTNGRVYRGADSPNDIMVVLDVADLATAKDAVATRLPAIMQEAGALGRPTIHYTE